MYIRQRAASPSMDAIGFVMECCVAASPLNRGTTPPSHWSPVIVVACPPLYEVKSIATWSAKIERYRVKSRVSMPTA